MRLKGFKVLPLATKAATDHARSLKLGSYRLHLPNTASMGMRDRNHVTYHLVACRVTASTSCHAPAMSRPFVTIVTRVYHKPSHKCGGSRIRRGDSPGSH